VSITTEEWISPDEIEARVDPGTVPCDWLVSLDDEFASRAEIIVSQFGSHAVRYEEDEDGAAYALVGFARPEEIYTGISDETYGRLAGWRVLLDSGASWGRVSWWRVRALSGQ